MSGVLAKGLIITASVIVAAGIAILSDENVRNWLDARRREIAMSLYSMGDGINPNGTEMRSRSESELSEDSRQRRDEIIQRNRMALIQKAQEEGVAVDLDELAAVGLEEEKAAIHPPALSRADTLKSFDTIVGSDGTLRDRNIASEKTDRSTASGSSFQAVSDAGLKQRSGRGFAAGAAAANPFDDEAQLLFDQELIGASVGELPKAESVADSHTVRSVSPRPATEEQVEQHHASLVDIPVWETDTSTPQPQYKTDDELEAEIQEAIRRSLTEDQQLIDLQATSVSGDSAADDISSTTVLEDSLYAPASPRVASLEQHRALNPQEMTESSTIPSSAFLSKANSFHSAMAENDTPGAFQKLDIDDDADGEHTPSGALTPTEDGFSTISSAVGRSAPDIANLADFITHTDDNVDARSEAATNDSYSVVGASTPGTWTDVDSESETEAVNGQSHIIRRS